jgi:hypothetical protein
MEIISMETDAKINPRIRERRSESREGGRERELCSSRSERQSGVPMKSCLLFYQCGKRFSAFLLQHFNSLELFWQNTFTITSDELHICAWNNAELVVVLNELSI